LSQQSEDPDLAGLMRFSTGLPSRPGREKHFLSPRGEGATRIAHAGLRPVMLSEAPHLLVQCEAKHLLLELAAPFGLAVSNVLSRHCESRWKRDEAIPSKWGDCLVVPRFGALLAMTGSATCIGTPSPKIVVRTRDRPYNIRMPLWASCFCRKSCYCAK